MGGSAREPSHLRSTTQSSYGGQKVGARIEKSIPRGGRSPRAQSSWRALPRRSLGELHGHQLPARQAQPAVLYRLVQPRTTSSFRAADPLKEVPPRLVCLQGSLRGHLALMQVGSTRVQFITISRHAPGVTRRPETAPAFCDLVTGRRKLGALFAPPSASRSHQTASTERV